MIFSALGSRLQASEKMAAWGVFAVSLTLYLLTVDPSVSYWDCPEYVTTASLLEIGHPPGNPFWTLAMRVATIPFPQHLHAVVINICSCLFTAFAAFFLCKTIFIPTFLFLKKYLPDIGSDTGKTISGLVSYGGSLCFSFCDSVWFSAVEAEVYAMSIFITSLSLWLMVKYYFEPNEGKRTRLLMLVAYLTGISLGVHQLNLLCIPVFAMIWLYSRNPAKMRWFKIFITLFVSCAIIVFILTVVMGGFIAMAEKAELLAVNGYSMPYNSGVIVFTAIIFIIVIFLSALFQKIGAETLANGFWMLFFILVGFSSFALIMIRSAAAPPMNEGSPSNIFAFSSYLSRDQYGSTPLIYGKTPYSRPIFKETYEDGSDIPTYHKYILNKGKAKMVPAYPSPRLHHISGMVTTEDSTANKDLISQGDNAYLLADYTFTNTFTPELNIWFPRLTSSNSSDIKSYEAWAGMTKEKMNRVKVSETIDSAGNPVPLKKFGDGREWQYSYRPTYIQNFTYFITYQVGYMYFRYLLWNFLGRQNDVPATGEIDHGSFITGLTYLDNLMLGDQDKLPAEIGKGNAGHNVYYGIPFILGIIGIIFLWQKGRNERRVLSLIALLFFMTGIAIVIYLNQTPGEPRERDYSFLGSYMAFCIWIAAGLLCLSYLIIKAFSKANNYPAPGKTSPLISKKTIAIIIIAFISLAPGAIMACVNFDDHNRSGRHETYTYASNILDLDRPTIIFSQGDNYTFPLWYTQEVGRRGDGHTIVDATYLSMPDYLINLKKQGEKGLKLIATESDIAYGAYAFTRLPYEHDSEPRPLKEVLMELYANKTGVPTLSTCLVTIPGEKPDETITLNLWDFSRGNSTLSFRHLMLLDIIASNFDSENPRSLYFLNTVESNLYSPLIPWMQNGLYGRVFNIPSPESSVTEMKKQIERILTRLEEYKGKTKYSDGLVRDQSRRQRAALIIGANILLDHGDHKTAEKISQKATELFPYSLIPPGTFTTGDTTFYEGIEYIKLLNNLYEATKSKQYLDSANLYIARFNNRWEEWHDYYNSLSPAERKIVSNATLRELTYRKKLDSFKN